MTGLRRRTKAPAGHRDQGGERNVRGQVGGSHLHRKELRERTGVPGPLCPCHSRPPGLEGVQWEGFSARGPGAHWPVSSQKRCHGGSPIQSCGPGAQPTEGAGDLLSSRGGWAGALPAVGCERSAPGLHHKPELDLLCPAQGGRARSTGGNFRRGGCHRGMAMVGMAVSEARSPWHGGSQPRGWGVPVHGERRGQFTPGVGLKG